MTTRKATHLVRRPLRVFATATGLLLALGTFSRAGAAEEVKDHVLFVGTDFGIVINGQEHPVIDAGSRTFVFQDGSKRREKPLRELPHINIRRGLKLTTLTANIDQMEAALTSDAKNAEIADQTFNLMALQTMADMTRDHAYGQLVDADVGRMGVGSSQLQITGHDQSVAASAQIQQGALQNATLAEQLRAQQDSVLHDLLDSTGSAAANDGTEVEITPEISNGGASLSVSGQLPHVVADTPSRKTVTKSVVDAGNGRSDHLDLNFEISAPTPLDSAYLVVTTEYNVPNSDEVFRRILTERIGHIDAKPRKISLYETNYPAGFHLRTYVVSVYANGQEVATNLSETKMRMTRDEAYQYLMVDYIASHRGQTLPPAAILMAPRAELSRVTAGDDAMRPIYVSVDQNGAVIRVSADERGHRDVNPSTLAALDKFRFIPALNKGVPVAGHAHLVLADFIQ